MVPTGIKPGDVIRIKSVVASILSDFQHVLVPTDHSNILVIHKSFKLYRRFHNKTENSEHDLSLAILGCSNNPTMLRQANNTSNSDESMPMNKI